MQPPTVTEAFMQPTAEEDRDIVSFMFILTASLFHNVLFL